MMRPSSAILLVCVPIFGCAEPAPPKEASPEPSTDPIPAEDHRPEAGVRLAGEDVTEQARVDNAPGKEPPAPSRRGTAVKSRGRLKVRKEPDGFSVKLPRAHSTPSPAFHRGRVYAGGYGAYDMFAFEAKTGKTDWAVHLSDDGPTDPACKDGVCVFNTFSCTLFGIDADTGKHLWSWYLGAPQLATPVIAGNIVYSSYPTYGGPQPYALAAFELRTGKPLWRRWIDAEVQSTPVAHGGRVFVATRLGTLYQLGATDGEVVSVVRNRITSVPVVTAQGLLFGREEPPRDNDMIAMSSPLFPELETAAPAPTGPVSPQPRPLLAQNRIVEIKGAALVATHRQTGRRLWKILLGGDADRPADIAAPLLHAGPAVLVATASGNVLRVEPDSGEVQSVFRLGHGQLASQPIAVDGWIYAGTMEGALVAHDTHDAALTGWEMLGGGPDRRGTLDPEGT